MTFICTLLVVLLLPGPDMVLLLQTSSLQGRLAALACAAGLAAARVGHVVLAATGLAALLQTSRLLFEIVEMVGATYLIWLGISIWRSHQLPSLTQDTPARPAASIGRSLRRGLLTNITNPKALLFCSLLLPQFINAERGHVTGQFAFYGSLIVGLGFAFDASLCYAGENLGHWMERHPGAQNFQRHFFGFLLVAFGIVLAVT